MRQRSCLKSFTQICTLGGAYLAFLQILEDRYARKSTIFASQIPVENWYVYIDEPTTADAILDRIVPKVHRFDLKVESLSNKK